MINQLSFNSSRVEDNIKAIASLASSQPKVEMLKHYSGWGGLREAIYTPSIYGKLKKILSDDDINSIKSTLKTAYFTPKLLVDFIYQVVSRMGCAPDAILEPSAGHGVFIEHMPQSIRKNARITAVEIDKISCQVLRALYSDVDAHQTGFEDFSPQDKFELIVGNPPFGQIYVDDKHHPDLSKISIHHYFVAKCMRLLKEDGILAMVLPRYFLDAPQKHVRQIIANEGGSLVAAYRLPDDLFDDAKVTVDVVFLRKSKGKTAWIQAKKVADEDAFAYINQYFLDHPENIIGKLDFFEVYGRTEITCKRTGDVSVALYSKLDDYSNNQQQIEAINKKIVTLREEYKQLVNIKGKIDQFGKQLADLYKLLSNKHSVVC